MGVGRRFVVIYFTSDQHFEHANIIKMCNRPFSYTAEMNYYLVSAWNSVVGRNDTVYHLGDFTLKGKNYAKYFFSELNGKIKVLSNPWHHDSGWITKTNDYVSKSGHKVEILPPMVVLEFSEYGSNGYDQAVVLCHYPIAQWDRKHYGSWHLHGHSHGNYVYPENTFAYDVGVDNNEFKPVSLDNIVITMKLKGWRQNV